MRNSHFFKTSQIKVIDVARILWFRATVCVVWCGTGHEELTGQCIVLGKTEKNRKPKKERVQCMSSTNIKHTFFSHSLQAIRYNNKQDITLSIKKALVAARLLVTLLLRLYHGFKENRTTYIESLLCLENCYACAPNNTICAQITRYKNMIPFDTTSVHDHLLYTSV